MSVTIPSDIVLDVMRAVNARDVRASTAKLIGSGGVSEHAELGFMGGVAVDSPDESFEKLLSGSAEKVRTGYSDVAQLLAPSEEALASNGKNSADTYKSFEQMFLRNMFESLLPSSESGAFGDRPSGGVWRSMAADQFAGVYAKAGGIGLAAAIHAPYNQGALQHRSEWPYFEANSISGFTG